MTKYSGSCVPLGDFSTKTITQTYKGVLCCSQVCGVVAGSGTIGQCTDSDGGSNYSVKGTASDSSGKTGTDSCTADKRGVIEFSCEGNNLASKTFSCPNGCLDGACIS